MAASTSPGGKRPRPFDLSRNEDGNESDAPPLCSISGCDQKAGYWFEELSAPSQTFYLCADHFLQATNAEGEAVILDPVTGRFETRLTGSDVRRIGTPGDTGGRDR